MNVEELKEAIFCSNMDTEAKAEVYEILTYSSIRESENA